MAVALLTVTLAAGVLPASPAAAADRGAPAAGKTAGAGGTAGASRVVSNAMAVADSPRPALLRSRYEVASGKWLDRDCGWSRQIPRKTRQDFWLFCDTAIEKPPGTLACSLCFIPGSTAAEGPFTAGLVPVVSELPAPPGRPVLPNSNPPKHFMTNPGIAGCTGSHEYPARWSSGVVREPSSANLADFLITYTRVCVQGPFTFPAHEFGVVEYDPATNRLGGYHAVFTGQKLDQTAPQWLVGSPVLGGDGYLYLYSSCNRHSSTKCPAGGSVFLARVPARPSAWVNKSSYTFFTGRDSRGRPLWGSYTRAVSDVPGATPAGTGAWTADNYTGYPATRHRFVAVEQTSDGGDYVVWTATSPAGPWTAGKPGRLCPAGDACHALIGHPELSTARNLLVSYWSHDAPFHIKVAAVPW